jgi:hypothetical protein
MYTLIKKTVNGISVQGVFENHPTKEEFYNCIFQYFDHQESLDAAQELEDGGYASMNDMFCTEFELQKA